MSDLKVEVIEHEGEEYAHKSIVIALTNECEQLEARVKELVDLVESAYKEGYYDGTGLSPSDEWEVSDSKNELEEYK